jgi:hypothetical protein
MENLSQFMFGLVDTVKKTFSNDPNEDAADIAKRKSLIYGELF